MSGVFGDAFKELDDAWRRIDISMTIEDQARDVSRDLKYEVGQLQQIVEDDKIKNADMDNT